MNTKKMMLMTVFCAVLLVVGVTSSASALTIDATDYIYPGGLPSDYWWAGDETSQAALNAIIASITGNAPELYKQNTGAPDEGSFAPYYQTTYSNTPADPSNALIEYVGGPGDPYINASPLYLLVKDGSQEPAWYLFGLNYSGAPYWNGTDDLVLLNFWPNQGAISHVAFYGTGTAVPEPLTLLLLGFGFVGLAAVRRFKK
jgi:hypothetical protein